ncbi:hypothetical protein VKT23_012232 [Stygiomarasmius scandens]|uniref:Uncharacterized protein n=1 Tax=Marasmiellus scandens TaxID=2682957 RepID=A0ABR1J6E2_9AGAR
MNFLPFFILFASSAAAINITITSPTSRDVWRIGEKRSVIWNTDDLNSTGRITLASDSLPKVPSYNALVLVPSVNLADSIAEVTVPSVPTPLDNYYIVIWTSPQLQDAYSGKRFAIES